MRRPEWQKSSFSAANNECVEIRTAGRAIELRESDEGETILRTTPAALAALLRAIKGGQHNHHI